MPFNPDQPRGPDGKWIKGKTVGAVLGAGLMASLMAAAGGGDATTSISAGLDAATSETSVDQAAVEKDTADSQRDAKKGDDVNAWRRQGLKELKKKIEHDLQCAVQRSDRYSNSSSSIRATSWTSYCSCSAIHTTT